MSMSIQGENMLENKQHEVFICGKCNRQPMQPVVTECGHIFCWKCIFNSHGNTVKCSVCEHLIFLSNCYPIFIQHEQEILKQHAESRDLSMPNRPQPSYREKIINPGMGNSNLPAGLTHLQSNLQFRKQVPGLSFIPPMIVNSFNKISKPTERDPDCWHFNFFRKLTYPLGLTFLIVVLLVLFF